MVSKSVTSSEAKEEDMLVVANEDIHAGTSSVSIISLTENQTLLHGALVH